MACSVGLRPKGAVGGKNKSMLINNYIFGLSLQTGGWGVGYMYLQFPRQGEEKYKALRKDESNE